MRKIVFISLIFSSVIGFSESGKITGFNMEVQVLSNKFNDSVPTGTFAVRGRVRMQSGLPVFNAIITNQSESISVSTDSNGFFQMLFPISDTAIYCYKIGLNEITLQGPFNNRHLIEVDFYLQDPKVPVVCTKPVIYAYNAASDFSLSLKPHGGFSFTYPKYEDGWDLKTNADGGITDLETGKNYPYLFWEGPGKNLDFISSENTLQGYLIKTDTCVSFFENVLAEIGLNQKEATDFITWWGPQLMKEDYALIQFLTGQQYAESIAEIDLIPAPDAMLRLYMYYMPLENLDVSYNVVPQNFSTFNRQGFTVVEWGGSVLTHSRLIN